MHEALDSLLAQTVQDWELVAWDDGSTDDTCSILRSYMEDRFRIFQMPHGRSLASARQAAMHQCRGEWLAFLDQDDIWLPDKLSLQLQLADRSPDAAMIYGRALTFRGRGPLRDYDHRHAGSLLPEGNIFIELFRSSCFICMSTAMIKAHSLSSVPPMPDFVRLTPDYYLYLNLAQDQKVYAVQQPVSLYRRHLHNVSALKGKQVHEECLSLITRFGSYLDPALLQRRLRVHESLVAFSLMSSPRTLGSGFQRLLKAGSPAYVASRPFAKGARALKRWLKPAPWRTQYPTSKSHTVLAASAKPTLTREFRAFQLLGTEVSVTSFEGALQHLSGMVQRGRSGYLCNANVYSVMLARTSQRLRHCLTKADFVSADGMPVVWLLRALGQNAERVHGDDVLFACCERFPLWRHYFVGGRQGQVEQVCAALLTRYPTLCIAGAQPTPQRPVPAEHTEVLLSEIAAAKADIVWVGMGTPAQDYWMSTASPRLSVPMVGVGSAFDSLSGHSRPAPDWMKKAGLQWLFRLVQEPRRLLGRYLYYNTLFVAAVTRLLAHAAAARCANALRRMAAAGRWR